MAEVQFETPIVLIIFNRPDTTKIVFEAIAKVRPRKLLIIGDGSRIGRDGEEERVLAARSIVAKVNWDCEVLTNYSDENLGCKRRVSTGLDWAFEQVEEAIILEDDCLPSGSFFSFCEDMLIRYRNDNRVWHIDGTNFQNGGLKYDYDFSKYPLIWGWATWRRAWKNYDVNMATFDTFKKNSSIKNIWRQKEVQEYWMKNFEFVRSGALDTWDYQWFYCVWINNGLVIRPNINLIKNIGFGADATHTLKSNKLFDNMIACDMGIELSHPEYVVCNEEYDHDCSKVRFGIIPRHQRILNKISRRLRSLID